MTHVCLRQCQSSPLKRIDALCIYPSHHLENTDTCIWETFQHKKGLPSTGTALAKATKASKIVTVFFIICVSDVVSRLQDVCSRRKLIVLWWKTTRVCVIRIQGGLRAKSSHTQSVGESRPLRLFADWQHKQTCAQNAAFYLLLESTSNGLLHLPKTVINNLVHYEIILVTLSQEKPNTSLSRKKRHGRLKEFGERLS